MAHPKFCSSCGTPLNVRDKFCPNCGIPVLDQETSPGPGAAPPPGPAPSGASVFPCMLAYIPGLFWLPLAADSKSRFHRDCANQGLLLLLYCILLPAGFSLIAALLCALGVLPVAQTPTFIAPATTYPSPSLYPPNDLGSLFSFFDGFGEAFRNFGALFQPLGNFVFPNFLSGTLLFIVYALLSLYAPVNSIWGFIHCANHRDAHILPLIGKIRIIK